MNWERVDELVALGNNGREEDAIAGFEHLISPAESAEDNANILMLIGASQKAMRHYEEARGKFARARALANPDSWIQARVLHHEASIDIVEGNWKAALIKLETVVTRFSHMLKEAQNQDLLEEVRRKRGMALYSLGRPKEALPLLQEAALVEYQRATTLYYLGRCNYDLGRLASAKEAFRETLALDLDKLYVPSAHYLLGLTCHWLGEYAWAVREFEWCLDHDEEGRVAKGKVLVAIVQSLKAIGMEHDAQRYSNMLNTKPAPPHADNRTR